MAEKKSAEDRVADLDKKIKQMQAQKRAILQREKEAARKARTKRLIRIGAEVEAYCGEITDLDAFKDYLQQYSAAIRGTQKKEQKDSRYDPDDLLAFLGQEIVADNPLLSHFGMDNRTHEGVTERTD